MRHGFEGKDVYSRGHTYTLDVFLEASREHVFLRRILELIHF